MLALEHLAAAPDARLNLIEDQEDAVAVAELAQARQKSIGGDEIATLPLDGLDENGGHFVRRYVVHEQDFLDITQHRAPLIAAREQGPVTVGVRYMRDSRHGRKEALLLRVLARRERQRPHRSAVKAAEKTDKPAAAGHVTRQLERRL